VKNKFRQLWHLVGNTPMIEILYEFEGKPHRIYAKCEHYNLTGSVKDRMALYILQQSYEQGLIRRGDHIVEATSGNTGISFSALGRNLGHKVTIIMPDWLSKERKDIILSLGADVKLVSKQQGGFVGSIQMAENMTIENGNVFLPRQFENRANIDAHSVTTAPEIRRQLLEIGFEPAAFVAGVGTGGTVMGVAAYFRRHFPGATVHPMEPFESPTLSTGFKVGSHRIQGISDEFIPSIVKLDELDSIVQVSDSDAIMMAQKMASQLGLAVGISSGANIVAAMKLKNDYYPNSESVVVTILPDSNKKYLSTDLMKEQKTEHHYLSPRVQLIDFHALPKCENVVV
jgi:cysteine synthase A